MMKSEWVMHRNPILDLPLTAVMREEIALPLQQLLQINTVGALLVAWRCPSNHESIEDLFDTPQQARNAVAVCATWLGMRMQPSIALAGGWSAHRRRSRRPERVTRLLSSRATAENRRMKKADAFASAFISFTRFQFDSSASTTQPQAKCHRAKDEQASGLG